MNTTLLVYLRNKARNDLTLQIDRFFYREKGVEHDSVYIAHITDGISDDIITEQYIANLYPSFEYFDTLMADRLRELQRDYILSLIFQKRERMAIHQRSIRQLAKERKHKLIRLLRFFRSLINHK